MKKKYSVIVIPQDGQVKQFSVSRIIAVVLCSFLFISFGVGIFLSQDYLSRKVESHRIAELTEENVFLASKIELISNTIDELHVDIVGLTEKEKAIRTIFDLPEIDPQQRELGIGGPEMLPSEDILSATKLSAYQTEATIDRLFTLTSFEREQFSQIYDQLLQKKTDLDRTPSIQPANGYFARGYGIKPDPFNGEMHLHAGVDISNTVGTPIIATADGTVTSIGNKGRLGKTVVIDHHNGFETVYGHCDSYKIKRGQKVTRGQVIATVGNTGRSTGPHLHYGVRKNGKWVNPNKYIYTSDYLL